MHMAWPAGLTDQRNSPMMMPLYVGPQQAHAMSRQSAAREIGRPFTSLQAPNRQVPVHKPLVFALQPSQATNATILPPISKVADEVPFEMLLQNGTRQSGNTNTTQSTRPGRPAPSLEDPEHSRAISPWDSSLRMGNDFPASRAQWKASQPTRSQWKATPQPCTESSSPEPCHPAQSDSSPAFDRNSKDPVFTGVSKSGKHGRWRAQLCTGGRTIHLGTFSTQEEAARAWDLAVVAERGNKAHTNFDIKEYMSGQKPFCQSMEPAMKAYDQGKPENISDFSSEGVLNDTLRKPKTQPKFKGIYQSGSPGKYKARIVINKRKVHLGTFNSAEEAAREWDRAAILHRGPHIKTNFDISEYGAYTGVAKSTGSDSDGDDDSETDSNDEEAAEPVATAGAKRRHAELEKPGGETSGESERQQRYKRAAPSETSKKVSKAAASEPQSKGQSGKADSEASSQEKSEPQSAQGEESTRASLMSLLALCHTALPMPV